MNRPDAQTVPEQLSFIRTNELFAFAPLPLDSLVTAAPLSRAPLLTPVFLGKGACFLDLFQVQWPCGKFYVSESATIFQLFVPSVLPIDGCQ